MTFKTGFVSIIGKPNAGKSTLLNAILGENLVIVSPKVQTTRHRIFGILNEPEYQIIFSDTPGILDPKYKMQERMVEQIHSIRKDTDVLIFLMDAQDDFDENKKILDSFRLQKPLIFVINKMDKSNQKNIETLLQKIQSEIKCQHIICISALEKANIQGLLQTILELMPVHPPYFNQDEISDRPVRFFVEEKIREKIFQFTNQEIPYHAAVLIRSFEEKSHITRIMADIIVSRETQKKIVIGAGGSVIKKIAENARKDIEQFLDQKVFLEILVKVRKDWRENDIYLNEYGY